ncbi:MAG: ABC transporter ATP-binding protein [Verrucomicrobiales bacterium]
MVHPPSSSAVLIEARNITRSFQMGERSLTILHDVSFKVNDGEKVFLCGPSGAGKTSLLYTLAGLEAPTAGEVWIDGRPLYALAGMEQARVRNQIMGYVFQNYGLLPEFTALENVMLPSIIAGHPEPDRAASLLNRVGLGNRLGHRPAELSGGEQQRVAIARCLVNSPQVVFADEPTGNLDAKTGSAVMDLLLDLASEEKRALLVVTHDSRLAARGDRQLHLEDGRLVD